MKILIAAFLNLTSLVGCAAVGAKPEKPAVDGAGAAQLVVLCQTRLDELTARLGTPSRDGLLRTSHIVSWVTATNRSFATSRSW